MRPITYIRTAVFNVSQLGFAAIAGVTQGTVSRWERGSLQPSLRDLCRIREAALAQHLTFFDGLFFEAPSGDHSTALLKPPMAFPHAHAGEEIQP